MSSHSVMLLGLFFAGLGFFSGYAWRSGKGEDLEALALVPGKTGLSDFELVFDTARKLEHGLLQRYPVAVTGPGIGLHVYITAFQNQGGAEYAVQKLRFIATIRNKLAHDPQFSLSNATRRQFYHCRAFAIRQGLV